MIGGSLVLFPSTSFANILFATVGMLSASISFSFLVYTLTNRSQVGIIIAAVFFFASLSLYSTIEESVTSNGMAALGWNFVMASFRANQLLEAGVGATAPGYNLATAIVWLFIDAGLYLLLAW
jgi:hypothetical protein